MAGLSGTERERAVVDEAAGRGVADEERRDDEVQLVGDVLGQELGVDGAAALDHQAAYAALVQVLAQPAHRDPVTAVDDGGDRAEPGAGRGDLRGRAVDELLRVAGREEPGRRVEVGRGR